MKNFLLILLVILIQQQVILAQEQYTYTKGGSDWVGTCLSGSLQSPIDISNIQGTCDNSMTIDFILHNLDVETSVIKDQAGFSSNGDFSALYAKDVNGVLIGYQGTKIQLHLPSEHQIDGSSYDLEIQFHHEIKPEFKQSLDGQDPAVLTNAVVSLLFNVDQTTSTKFFTVWIPTNANKFSMNPASAFNNTVDSSDEYYSYQGSRTQPPCTEDVNWYIFPQTKPISQLEYNEIKKYITGLLTFANGNGNNRDTQSINSRTVKLGNIKCEEQFIYFFSFFILYIFINYFIFKLL